jgi:hypothetical protein
MKKMKNNVLMLGISALSIIFTTKVSAQSPTAGFSLSQLTVCVGEPVQITDISTDSPTAWSYTIEGAMAATSALQNPSATFTAAGVHTISLEATNGIGTSMPYTATIAVNALPNITAGSPVDVCAGSSIILNGSGASTYTWTGGVNDGVSFAATASAVYTVTGTDANGCKNSVTQTVTVKSLPTISVSGPTAVCLGSAITLTVAGADAYTWSNSGSNSDVITDSPASNITYSVVGTNTMTGCSNNITKAVTVNSLPIVTANNGSVCTGNVFTITPSGASTYVYSSGSQTVSPSVNATYTVTGTDANGCSASAVSDVTVLALPVISVNSGSICEGSAFTIVPNGAISYVYSGGSAVVSPVTNTSYTVTGADANNCVSLPVISDVTVSAMPVVSVNSGTICSGDMFTMNPSGALTYIYSNGSNTVVPTSNTNYTVTGTDAMGCVSNPAVSSVTVFALPIVSVNSGTICSGVSFTMTPSGASSYVYSNGSAIVSPLSDASYSVTGTSAQGCVSSNVAVSSVTVISLPVVSVTSGTICQGGIYTMTASGAATYVYSNGSQTVNPSVTTSYSVTGVASNGCVSSNTAVATITVYSLPALTITSNTAICSGDNSTLTVSGANSYVWNTTSTVTSIVVSPLTNTSYSVIGIDANGCQNMAVQLIAVNPLPIVTINSGAICPGGSFTLTPSGALTYVYSSGSPVVTPASTTAYSVVGMDANGCMSADAVATVSVVNALTISVSGNTTICNGQTASLTASGAITYSWSTNASGSIIAVSPSGLTSYTVTGTNSNCSNSTIVSVSVNALPSVSASSSSTLICSGETATLTAQGASSYMWIGGSSPTNSLAVNPTTNTTYTVTGTDANSCSSSAVVTQSVSDCVGLNKITNNGINASVYPNPNNGDFTITISNETSVKILNGIGQVVFSANLTQGDNSISLNNQPKGIYFVQLKQGQEIKILKVVKN